jgi:alpha-aminoadipic semialdehyde synthase
LPKAVGLPIIIGVLGSSGLCGKGSMEALLNLHVTLVKPNELKDLVNHPNDPKHRKTVYVCPFKTTDLVRH